MYTLVVLCTVLAVASARPGSSFDLISPITYTSTVLAPSTTTVTKQTSSVIHPSPYAIYPHPVAYTHFIKKRSAPLFLNNYIVPTSYLHTPLVKTYAATPVVSTGHELHSVSLTYAPTHFIKKRSAALAVSYVSPTSYAAATPLVDSSYTPIVQSAPIYHSVPIVHSTPIISKAPIVYASHFIKKRAAPLAISTYFAPSSFSHQSRIDVHSSPLVTLYAAPITYNTPFAYAHVL